MDLPEHIETFVDVLRWRAEKHPRRTAFTFVAGNAATSKSLSYADVDFDACSLGAHLQNLGAAGERAVLMLPNGLEFVKAFFGCLYGGVVAVPCAPLRAGGGTAALEAILRDTGAKFVLGTRDTVERAQRGLAHLPGTIKWVDVMQSPKAAPDGWAPKAFQKQSLAFLQYTSGSTGQPKGVIVSHGNIMANQHMICSAFEHNAQSTIVGWLPMFHDMGLIGNVMQPVFCGGQGVLLSPAAFVQRPMRWLEAISQFKGHTSGAPNFAFDLCVERFDPERCAELDLSGWKIAFNGAEPIDAKTMDRFCETFAPYGFKRQAFFPCYGLAEATLFVTSGVRSEPPVVRSVARDALASCRVVAADGTAGHTAQLVGCGHTRCGATIEIVDPETRRRCADGEVGEIWVSGDQVAQGYWNNPSATAAAFGARLADTASGEKTTYLRTGDLGFVSLDQLYIAGRKNDVIIIRGRNFWPQDIEKTATGCHPSLGANRGAAFALRDGRHDAVGIVVELKRGHTGLTDPARICHDVRAAVTAEYDVTVATVALVRSGTLPLTTSGKVQRRRCRKMLLDGALTVVSQDTRLRRGVEASALPPTRTALLAMPDVERRQSVAAHLAAFVASITGVQSSDISLDATLSALGVDSLAAAHLAHHIETSFGTPTASVQLLEARSLMACANLVADNLAKPMPMPRALLATGASAGMSMSEGQKALWFLQSLAPDSTAHNVTVAARIDGNLDIPTFRRAFQRLVDRHDILRARFDAKSGTPFCEIRPSQDIWFIHRDHGDGKAALTHKGMLDEARHAFDLANDPLLRIVLFTARGKDPVLVATAHHLIVDSWSVSVLLRELGAIYDAALTGEAARLPLPDAGFLDRVAQDSARRGDPEVQTAISQCSARIKTCPLETRLPLDRPLTSAQPHVLTVPVGLSADVTCRLVQLAKRYDTSLFTVLMAAWQVALHRLSGQERFTVGTLCAVRPDARFSETVGYFVNPVVIPCDLGDNPGIGDLIRRVTGATRAAFDHSDIPFPWLVEHFRPARHIGRAPLFSTMFNWHQSPLADAPDLARVALGMGGGEIPLGGLTLKPIPVPREALDGVMELGLGHIDGQIQGHLAYDGTLFDAATAQRAAYSFCDAAQALSADPPGAVLNALSCKAPAAGAPESQSRSPDLGEAATLDAVFRRHIATTPDKIALVDEGKQVTYAKLGRRCVAVARLLLEIGARRPTTASFPLVAILTRQNQSFVVGAFAVLQTGQGFVPLAADDPVERNAFKVADCGAGILITESALADEAREVARRAGCVDHVVVVDASGSVNGGASASQPGGSPEIHAAPVSIQNHAVPAIPAQPHRIAYAIYTSGTSSGQPKGVAVSQDSLLALLAWQQTHVARTVGSRSALILSVTFDVGLWDLLSTLLGGGTVIFPSPALRQEPRRVPDFVNRHAASVVYATPTLMREALSDDVLTSVDAIMLIGETLDPALLQRILDRSPPDCDVINAYGPTEATVFATLFATNRQAWQARADTGDVPIGRSVAQTGIQVFDRGDAVPNGRMGEIFIGGRGVALCYLNKPGQTAAAFVPDPTSEAPGARLYRTGDFGAFSTDGMLRFHGRMDQQVKIRGFRVEPQEVEAVLNRHPDIGEAAVVPRAAANAPMELDAFVILRDGCGVSAQNFRKFAELSLPGYMVPTRFFRIPSLPRTVSGKLDRKAIEMDMAQPLDVRPPFAAPRTALEMLVAQAWSEELGIDRIGVHDDFFDLGGHSLKASKIHARLQERTGFEFPVAALFEHAEVRGLAAYLEGCTSTLAGSENAHPAMQLDRSGARSW